MVEGLGEDLLAFAHQMFELARSGDTERLAAYVDAGLPVNLTNDKGDALLLLAAYHGHPATVQAMLDRGADRGADSALVSDRGQSALAAAVFRRCAGAVTALLLRET